MDRTQTITLENGMEVIINHSSKHKCEKCKKEIIWALIPIELVSLAKWDIHKCVVSLAKWDIHKCEDEKTNKKRIERKN